MKTAKQKFTRNTTNAFAKILVGIIFLTTLTFQSNAQTDSISIEQTIFDRFGTTYSLQDILKPTTEQNIYTLTAGFFQITFIDTADHYGFSDTTKIDTTETGVIRRNIVAQYFLDQSYLIVPATDPCTGDTPLVEIKVSSINIAPDTNGAIPLGAASANYFPCVRDGIIDGEVWKTINTGVSDLPAGSFHGYMFVNFNSAIKWYYDLQSSTVPADSTDMYSMVAHEGFHLLGFTSFIYTNGWSLRSFSNPGMFSRYDTYLQYDTIAMIDDSCFHALFDTVNLNPPSNFINSGCDSVNYNGLHAGIHPVYSPGGYQLGSSLSHFEIDCNGAGSTPPYLMNPFLPTGAHRRVPTLAEVRVLCDLNYETTGVFGDSTLPFHTDTLPICGSRIAGVADGAAGICPDSTYIVSLCDSITIDDLLNNDENATSFACLEIRKGYGSLNAITNTSFRFTPSSFGEVILAYIPLDSNGRQGNATCIYITVTCCEEFSGCPSQSACR